MRIQAGLATTLVWFVAAPAVQPVSAGPLQQAPPLTARVRSQIDTDVQALLRAAHAPGATIAIVQGVAIVYTRGYGLRDVAKSLPAEVLTNTLDGGSDKIAEHMYNDLFPAIASAALREGEASQRAASAPMTDDERLYAKTITTMRDLPEPPYLTFVTNVTLHGNVSTTLLDRHGIAVFRIWTGKGGLGQPSGSWATSHRTSDDLGSIANTPQSHLLTHSALFNPTWTGAYDWLRYGVSGPQFTVKPVPVPQQSAGPDEHLTVIGVVKALSPSAYRITAAHTALCPGGEQGRHLQLAPRNGDIWVHPLTDVVIDIAQTRFCSMRFHSPAVDGVSFAELHFGSVHGYWMTTSVDTDLRQYGQLGIPGPRASWHFTYDELRFPDTLDDAIFSLPDDPVGSHGST